MNNKLPLIILVRNMSLSIATTLDKDRHVDVPFTIDVLKKNGMIITLSVSRIRDIFGNSYWSVFGRESHWSGKSS